MVVAGTRVLISYEGQPPTCYGCNEQGHQFQDCPRRKQIDIRQEGRQNPLWAEVVTRGKRSPPEDGKSQMNQNPSTKKEKKDGSEEYSAIQTRNPKDINEKYRRGCRNGHDKHGRIWTKNWWRYANNMHGNEY
jgi:hypothetical protein